MRLDGRGVRECCGVHLLRLLRLGRAKDYGAMSFELDLVDLHLGFFRLQEGVQFLFLPFLKRYDPIARSDKCRLPIRKGAHKHQGLLHFTFHLAQDMDVVGELGELAYQQRYAWIWLTTS